ncbi:hypothetical protein FVW20_09480 [Desulfovibrio oxamicus]|uniref:Phage tail assembly chaperone-like domain-containing protein n=1 Tax=Nitratidesulfovibrio oxamicus TaxID=32016 RepID=A0ABS0J487_9BACT|nr:tail fiber assembly protein [Nitratidesulfovibrio oxamicus]MBG3877240.1 hypothetical protein [Nitratidesulfovibrio oxamicus]
MHILVYERDTREYLRAEDWQPPHPWVALPADAVAADAVLLPDVRVGFARVLTMQADGWEYVEDHRGEAGWLPDGTPHTVTELGPLPEGWSEVAPAKTDEQAARDVRARRDSMLSACDYLMMQDYPLDAASRAEWVAYRQALRDLTAQVGFPVTVNWPEIPGK